MFSLFVSTCTLQEASLGVGACDGGGVHTHPFRHDVTHTRARILSSSPVSSKASHICPFFFHSFFLLHLRAFLCSFVHQCVGRSLGARNNSLSGTGHCNSTSALLPSLNLVRFLIEKKSLCILLIFSYLFLS